MSSSPPGVLLASHYLTDSDQCACGAATGDSFIEHAAEVTGLGTKETAELLEDLHWTDVLNAGGCGGCETCGNRAESYRCRVCGESSDQCVTSYVAGRFLRPPKPEGTLWE